MSRPLLPSAFEKLENNKTFEKVAWSIQSHCALYVCAMHVDFCDGWKALNEYGNKQRKRCYMEVCVLQKEKWNNDFWLGQSLSLKGPSERARLVIYRKHRNGRVKAAFQNLDLRMKFRSILIRVWAHTWSKQGFLVLWYILAKDSNGMGWIKTIGTYPIWDWKRNCHGGQRFRACQILWSKDSPWEAFSIETIGFLTFHDILILDCVSRRCRPRYAGWF